MARYMAATAMGGKLYPEGLSLYGPWQSEHLVLYPEEVVRVIAAPNPHDRLVTVPSSPTP